MRFKRFNKTFCTLALAALYTMNTYGMTVTDVNSSHWAYTAIVKLEEQKIMSLNGNGQFFPNEQMDYFAVVDVIAKATGYIDAAVTPNADQAKVAQIASNYEKQKPIIDSYVAKYRTWNSAYNQQIAYVLGRGYLTTKDLDKFITKTGNTEVKNVVTKDELSIYVVKMLGKAKTATDNYKTTGFKDENTISDEAKPYMAYLKSVGILVPDAKGNVNGKYKVTKALCAKMVYSALQLNGSLTTPTPNATVTQTASRVGTVTKVLIKSNTEYYVGLKFSEKESSFYSLKNTTKILDANGNEVPITTKLTGQALEVTLGMEGSTEYITSAKLATAGTSSSSSTTPSTSTVVDNNNVTEAVGTLEANVTNGICNMKLIDGTTKTYILDTNCEITLNGKVANEKDLLAGDSVNVKLNGSIITQIQATANPNRQNTSDDAIQSVGERKIIQGTLSQIIISATPQVTVNVNNTPTTYTLATNAEIYDINKDKNIAIRDLHLGQKVKLIVENNLVVTLKTDSASDEVNIMGSIVRVGKRAEYIDVLLDYDPISGKSKVEKRVNLSDDVRVLINGKNKDIDDLDKNMGIVVNYQYLDDVVPQKITVISE